MNRSFRPKNDCEYNQPVHGNAEKVNAKLPYRSRANLCRKWESWNEKALSLDLSETILCLI